MKCTPIETWDVHILYDFRERVDGHNNAGSLESHHQQIRLVEVVCYARTPTIEVVDGLMMIMMIVW